MSVALLTSCWVVQERGWISISMASTLYLLWQGRHLFRSAPLTAVVQWHSSNAQDFVSGICLENVNSFRISKNVRKQINQLLEMGRLLKRKKIIWCEVRKTLTYSREVPSMHNPCLSFVFKVSERVVQGNITGVVKTEKSQLVGNRTFSTVELNTWVICRMTQMNISLGCESNSYFYASEDM